MLTPSTMERMDDEHLLAAIRAESDPLTSTPVEQELTRRLERLLDENAKAAPLASLVEEYDLGDDYVQEIKAIVESHPASLKDMAAMLTMLSDEDIHEPDQLKEAIRLLKEFEAIANDAGDAITRLSQLITTAQE